MAKTIGPKLLLRTTLVIVPFLLAFTFDHRNPVIADYSDLVVVEGTGPQYEPDLERAGAISVLPAVPLVDFNGDGFTDSVVSSPLVDINGLTDVGAAWVFYGGPKGLKTKGSFQLQLSDFGIQPHFGDFFGIGTAAGDFNGDGLTDLAVGVSGLDCQFGNNCGAIVTYLGSKQGKLIPDKVYMGDEDHGLVGQSLASGDYNNDGFADLGAGAPGTTINGKPNAGSLKTFYGSFAGLIEGVSWDRRKIKGHVRTNAYFALRTFSGDINGDGSTDLISYTREPDQSGSVNVIYGGPNGLSSSGNQLIRLKSRKPLEFGREFAAASLNNSTKLLFWSAPSAAINDDSLLFMLRSSLSGVQSSGILSVKSPFTVAGDAFASFVAAAGIGNSIVLAVGSENATVKIGGRTLTGAGAVDLFKIRDVSVPPEFVLRYSGQQLGTSRNFGDRFGGSIDIFPGSKGGKIYFSVGIPGFNIGGKNDVGASVQYQFDPKTFTLSGSYRFYSPAKVPNATNPQSLDNFGLKQLNRDLGMKYTF
jgi:hypothetical protein